MGSSSSNDLPSKSQVLNQNNSTKTGNSVVTPLSNNQNNQDMNLPAPMPGQLMGDQKEPLHPIDEFICDKPSEKVSKPSKSNNSNNPPILNRNQNIPRQNQNIPQQYRAIPNQHQQQQQQYQQMPMAAGVASPYIQPVGVPLPYPGYPVPYYPVDPMNPYPYYPPQQPLPNTVVVLPPGYKPDYSPGYSPWGNLSEDLNNLL